MQTGEVQPEMRGGRCSPELRDPTQQLHWAFPAEKPPQRCSHADGRGSRSALGEGVQLFPSQAAKRLLYNYSSN